MERAWEQHPFADTTELRRAFEDKVLVASLKEQEALIAACSDIAELAAGKGSGRASQDAATLGLGEFGDRELKDLTTVPAAYREEFHRPLAVCVTNLADREHLIFSAWKHVETSKAHGARFALGEVIDIADKRFTQLAAGASPIRTAWVRKTDQVD